MEFLAENCAPIEMQDLMEDKVLSRACLKSLEIIGEASRNISDLSSPSIRQRRME